MWYIYILLFVNKNLFIETSQCLYKHNTSASHLKHCPTKPKPTSTHCAYWFETRSTRNPKRFTNWTPWSKKRVGTSLTTKRTVRQTWHTRYSAQDHLAIQTQLRSIVNSPTRGSPAYDGLVPHLLNDFGSASVATNWRVCHLHYVWRLVILNPLYLKMNI